MYVSLTGFGEKGSSAQKAGHDLNFLAESGFLNWVYDATQQKELPRYLFADLIGGGVLTAMRIMGSLIDKTKKNKRLTVSLADSMVYLSDFFLFPGLWDSLFVFSGAMARYSVYETRDKKFVALAALEDKFWHLFCDAVKKPHLSEIGLEKSKNIKAKQEVEKVFRRYTASYWQKFSEKYDVCLSVIQEKDKLLKSGMVQTATVKSQGKSKKILQSRIVPRKQHENHRSGEDNLKILRKLGYSQKRINKLKDDKII